MTTPEVKGVAGARNTGIDLAKGQGLAFLDGDDLWEPFALTSKIKALTEFPEAQIVSSDFCYRNDQSGERISKTVSNKVWNSYFGDSMPQSECKLLTDLPTHFFKTPLLWTGAVMANIEVIKKVGGFNEELKRGKDDHFWFRLALIAENILFVPKTLTLYRQRPSSLIHNDGPFSIWPSKIHALLL
jgi:glycosyltransferase involved in cell wall biosynthesis